MDIISEDIRQSEEYGRYMEWLGWKTVKLQIANCKLHIFIKKIGPVGVAKILRTSVKINWKEVDRVLKQNRVIQIKFEPRKLEGEFDDIKVGFHKDIEPLRATKTILVDLTPSENKILKTFKRARSWINKLRINNSELIIQFNEFDIFFSLWKQATKLQKIWSSNKKNYDGLVKSFGKKCFCVTVNEICGCLVLIHRGTAYYYYAASLPEAKEGKLGYIAVWEAMKEAKKRGCNTWDWEGIYDPRWPNKDWLGFSQFKKTFGGTEVEFPGSFSRWSLKNLLPTR